MDNPIAPHYSKFRAVAAVLAVLVSYPVTGGGRANSAEQSRQGDLVVVQNATRAVTATPNVNVSIVSWTFDSSSAPKDGSWTAERGGLTFVEGETRLQPDNQGRVILLSPPDLPATVRGADGFFLGVAGTGLRRVRVQARRDSRGGWITIADANGAALHQGADGYTIKRNSGSRAAPIERLRIELEFRTTNPRALRRVSAIPGPG